MKCAWYQKSCHSQDTSVQPDREIKAKRFTSAMPTRVPGTPKPDIFIVSIQSHATLSSETTTNFVDVHLSRPCVMPVVYILLCIHCSSVVLSTYFILSIYREGSFHFIPLHLINAVLP